MTGADPRRARSRRRLLDAAITLLLEGGSSAVTVDAVTRLSGVARTTLYRNFSSSQALVAAAFSELIPQAKVASTGTPREKLLDLMIRQYEMLLTAPLQDSLVAWLAIGPTANPDSDTASVEEDLGELRQQVLNRYLEPLHTLLDEAAEKGWMAAEDRALATTRLVGPAAISRLFGFPPLSAADMARIVDDTLQTPAPDTETTPSGTD